jgi:ribosomal protein L40E
MKCPECEHQNPERAKFCNNCGQKLNGICFQCGTQNAEEANFCSECGHKLLTTAIPRSPESIPEESKKAVQKTTREAERRQLTILFCDLVDSTPLSEALDAEDYRKVILDYQQVAEKEISKYGGHVAQYLGDGLLFQTPWPAKSYISQLNLGHLSADRIEAICMHPIYSSTP